MLQAVEKKLGTGPLRIISATYGKRSSSSPPLDVTTAVRFFVRDGTVRLPEGDKTAVLGFCRGEAKKARFKEARRR